MHSSSHKKGKIEISLKVKKKNIQLSVKDTGVGISPKNASRIFERFARVEAPGGRTYEGTGIGLSLVKELVKLHGGSIKVKSKEEEGSVFIVSIKKGSNHLPSSQILESQKNISTSDRDTFIDEATGWLPQRRERTRRSVDKKIKFDILVVDDNADMREYISSVLSPTYNVIALENGKNALTFFQKGFYPDLVISDVMMPGIDGYDLVNFVKNTAEFAHVPIILLSARTGEDAMIEAMGTGADNYLEKPFSSRQLLAFVKARLAISQRLTSASDIAIK